MSGSLTLANRNSSSPLLEISGTHISISLCTLKASQASQTIFPSQSIQEQSLSIVLVGCMKRKELTFYERLRKWNDLLSKLTRDWKYHVSRLYVNPEVNGNCLLRLAACRLGFDEDSNPP